MEKKLNLVDKESEQGKLYLTRKKLHYFFTICFFSPLIPIFLLALNQEINHKALFFSCLASALGFFCSISLLGNWEKKMRRSMNDLIQNKIEQIQGLAQTSEEIALLKTHSEEARRGYEHQIDLLQTSIQRNKDLIDELYIELNQKTEENHSLFLELDDLKKEHTRLKDEEGKNYEDLARQLTHKETLISDYQHTIGEQRMIIEKKQRYIAKLEGKVRDLMYEIRSLLQLEETPPPVQKKIEASSKQDPMQGYYLPVQSRVKPVYDLAQQLQRYIENAERFTGVQHLGSRDGKTPRFFEMIDSCAIDQRRFFDSLRDENVGILFVFSVLDQKFLFVNNFVKTATGWSPEKFMKDFAHIVSDGLREWKQAISRLASVRECQNKLVILCKSGEEIPFDCRMGFIAKGPFMNQIIGIMSRRGSS